MPDLTIEPWLRLTNLAPPGTAEPDLQVAANRYMLTVDVYAAAADLWEDAAYAIDTSPPNDGDRLAMSVTQGDIQVLYGADSLDTQATRLSRQASYLNRARKLRVQSKAYDVEMHETEDNPYIDWYDQDDYDPALDLFIHNPEGA